MVGGWSLGVVADFHRSTRGPETCELLSRHEVEFLNFSALRKRLGPGFITGASDDDPGAIGTYIAAGAQFGYLQLWTALFTFPVMAAVQEMCGRIGIVTGQGLAAVIRNNYARPWLMLLVAIQVITNTINIGADLSAMSESENLLWHVPYYVLLALTTVAVTALIVLVPYRNYATYLKFLSLALLTYVMSAFTVHVDWRQVLTSTFLPHIEWNKDFILTLIAVFGVTISPYAFFWQSNEEVEELVEDHNILKEESSRPQTLPSDVRFLRWDTTFGMFFSNVITFFVIITAAATLYAHGHTNVQSAAQAAEVLRPLGGPFRFVLFTSGIVSAGLLAIPVIAASSAYAVAGAFGWSRSLGKPFWHEWGFYGVIVASCAIGLLVNLLHVPPFKLLYYSGVLNGVISPPLLFIVTDFEQSENYGAVHQLGLQQLCGVFTLRRYRDRRRPGTPGQLRLWVRGQNGRKEALCESPASPRRKSSRSSRNTTPARRSSISAAVTACIQTPSQIGNQNTVVWKVASWLVPAQSRTRTYECAGSSPISRSRTTR